MRARWTLALLLGAAGWTPLAAWNGWSLSCVATPFADAPNPEACFVAQDQLMMGCGGGLFCPENPVVRAQAAMFLERMMRGTAVWSAWQGWSAYGSDNNSITIVISPVPGDPAASGQRLRQFLEGIPASTSEHYLVKLEPGTYDLGSTKANVESWVVLAGSGAGVTRLLGSPAAAGHPILALQPDTELRQLTVGPAPNGHPAIGITAQPGPRLLREVNLEAAGTALSCGGALGIGLRLSRVSVTSVGGANQAAVASTECDLVVEDSILSAVGAGSNTALSLYGKATVRRSLLEARDGTQNRGASVSAGSPGPLVIEDSRVVVGGNSGQALAVGDGHAIVRRSTLAVGDGLDWVLGGWGGSSQEIEVTGSRLAGGQIGASGFTTIELAHSQMDGTVIGVGQGDVVCHAVFDQNFQNANGIAACP